MIKKHWLKVVLGILIIGQLVWTYTLSVKPAMVLTKDNVNNLAQDDNALRNTIVPFLQLNVNSNRLTTQ